MGIINPAELELKEAVYDDMLKAVPDNYSYKNLAADVANIIKNEYGSHNIKPFIQELSKMLNEAPMVQSFPKMKVDKTVRTIAYIRQEIRKIENVQKLRDPAFSKYKNEFLKVERALKGLANGIQRHASILASEATFPKSDDIFRVKFMRPFWKTDNLRFTINSYDGLDEDSLKSTMKEIRVVPNPYVATNVMEPAVSNQFLNQRRRLLFTNIPAQATIKIFTVSGVLVDEIIVNNSPQDGGIHWDMLTREGLEIAAGMYLYHVESLATGDVKLGKFAVIK